MRFAEKVAIVTGGGSGIGLASAKRLGREGARLVLAGLNEERLSAAAEEVRGAGAPEALGLVCDVADEQQVEAAVARTVERFGHLNVVVNSAGLMVFKRLEEQTAEDWRKVLDVDLLGTFYFIKQAFLHMRRGGAIVNVSSIHALETTPLVSAYAAAKAAVLSLTRSAALEGEGKGIRVNAVLPGAVNTPMLWKNPNVKSGLEKIDRGNLGQPEDVAAVVAFLAADEAKFVRGSFLVVDGGRIGKL